MKDFPEAEPSCAPVHPKTSSRCGERVGQCARWPQAWAPNTCRTLYSGSVSAQSTGSPFFSYLEAHIIEHCLSDEFQTLPF